MELNKGIDKTAIMTLSRSKSIKIINENDIKFANLAKSYKYLGNIIKTRKDGRFFINNYSIEQSKIRLPKFRLSLNWIGRCSNQDIFNYKSLKILIESCIRGNFYGMGNSPDKIEKKLYLKGFKGKFEVILRKLIRKITHAPK
mmetsp:Transcript_26167/g.25774  ORF Transcript_26167/g.25774 Transcript_26167/m.25774 type:complete len:143 (-) Transcript_26167:301-729(-)